MFNFNKENSIFLSLKRFEKITSDISNKLNSNSFVLNKKIFANSEILITCKTSLENKDVFFVHSTYLNVNETIMELFISLDSIRQQNPKSINLIIPFLAYTRQDRISTFGEPITSKMIIKMIELFNVNKIITFDLHSDQVKSYFLKDKLVNLSFTDVLLEKLLNKNISNLSLVAPDLGRTEQIEKISKKLNIPIIQILKERPQHNKTIVKKVIGNIKNRNLILIDDMIDTGNTLLNSIDFLKNLGAKDIYVLSTHGIFSNNAIESFEQKYKDGKIKRILISNTILQKETSCLEVLSIVDCIVDFLKNN